MSRAQIRKEREKAWLAVLLAWVAGCVDAVGYLMLFHLFTAHMSGNSAARLCCVKENAAGVW